MTENEFENEEIEQLIDPVAEISESGGVADKQRDSMWLICAGLIIAVAGFLRFFWLELKPLHHDEGVNGHFLTTLFRTGEYHYDPSNYHGPDLYYLSLAFTKIFGLNTLSVRWSVAIFGVLTVVLALYLKRHIGKVGSLAAALFLALSPGMVFISRYFIHEILFVFLSLAIVVAVLLFFDREKAGIGAVLWMVLLLALCFMPVSLIAVGLIAGKSLYLLWILSIAVLVFEAVLIFFVIRMLMDWQDGRPIYLILASASAVLLYATKETAFITHGTMIIALVCVFVWGKLTKSEFVGSNKRIIVWAASGLTVLATVAAGIGLRERVGDFYGWFFSVFSAPVSQIWLFWLIVILGVLTIVTYLIFVLNIGKDKMVGDGRQSIVKGFWGNCTTADKVLVISTSGFVFVYLLLLFYTSFFLYPADMPNFFRAYAFWAKTGSSDHTQGGVLGYIKWMLHIEAPLVFLSILGTLFAVIRGKNRFALFSGLWAFGLFVAYTIISYKTPWLALSFLLPMCIIAGYAVDRLLTSKDITEKVLGVGLSVLAVAILAFQTFDLNFVRYDDESLPYVYAHTSRGFEDLVRDAKLYGDKKGLGTDATIEIISNEYWPMPWYFNDYKKANFHGKLVEVNAAEVIIANSEQKNELPEAYSRHYKWIKKYPLRPGVDLYLLVRNDLAGDQGKNLYEME